MKKWIKVLNCLSDLYDVWTWHPPESIMVKDAIKKLMMAYEDWSK